MSLNGSENISATPSSLVSAGAHDTSTFTIGHARIPEDIPVVRELFTAYALWLNIDLAFQGFEAELDSLPGKYAAANGGRILLARRRPGSVESGESEVLGCVALRGLAAAGPGCSEVKRLWVTPAGRGTGVGKALMRALADEAKEIGYTSLLLDTLSHMTPAVRLYEGLGYTIVPRYNDNPQPNVLFYGRAP
jgi:ribosomal protein S18 acetylase RimI-like enzyme